MAIEKKGLGSKKASSTKRTQPSKAKVDTAKPATNKVVTALKIV